ncbi:MAG: DUF2250 domain-containing protein [candidate division Zixibacteria bacterium]|nr:DUF2250 domain-containing protein [candidate division Zixibacteria bacterium]
MSIHGMRVKEGYTKAKCCSPEPDDSITGYTSYDNMIVVHKTLCENLKKVEAKRLFSLSWDKISENEESKPDSDYSQLDGIDFRILGHHQVMGVDYAWVVAEKLNLEPQLVFERHKKLKDLKLLERVQKVMIQYRKNIVDHKWIKHRNHTYYRITPKGEKYLNFFIGDKNRNSGIG